jgi:hypothetical protein
LRGEGFLELFENLDGMLLKRLHMDLGSVYDINDIVIEGLVMLLSNLNELTDFYLDLYEVDRITEDGYLLLAQGLSEM